MVHGIYFWTRSYYAWNRYKVEALYNPKRANWFVYWFNKTCEVSAKDVEMQNKKTDTCSMYRQAPSTARPGLNPH